MRTFQILKGKSTLRILLCVLGSINLLFLGVICVYEIRTHNFQIILSDLGVCSIKESYRPDYWCVSSWTKCVQKLKVEAEVAFFGNSITAGSNFHDHFPDVKIIELGYSGDRIDGMTRRIPMLQAVNPKKIFIMAGINDLHRSSPKTIYQRYDKLLTSIKEALPQTSIYVQSILPVSLEKEKTYATNGVIKETNLLIEEICQKHNCTYIDLNSKYVENGVLPDSLSKDGVHLKSEAYGRWAQEIRKYIYE